MLQKRIITAVVGIPLLVFVINAGGFIFAAVVAGLIVLGLWEFHNLCLSAGRKNPYLLFASGGVIIPFTVYFEPQLAAPLVFFYLLLCFVYYLLAYPGFNPLDLALSFLGVIYTVGGFSFLIPLRNMESGLWLVIYVFIIVWSTDTGAYFAGIYLGKRKMSPHISPNKTWAGFIGGLLCGFMASLVYFALIDVRAESALILFSPLVSLGSQVGDLFESSLKRFAGAKDSGTIIPGHGGILDRFDSMLWAAPLTYYLLVVLERMQAL
jgi:phosphatidate cytidylyltransferase